MAGPPSLFGVPLEADEDHDQFGRADGHVRQFPFTGNVILGRMLSSIEDGRHGQDRIQLERFEIGNQPDFEEDPRRRNCRLLAALAMICFLLTFFRSHRNALRHQRDFGASVAPFPWDSQPFAADGAPYETLFFDQSKSAILRSRNETYIHSTKMECGPLALIGDHFFAARPSSNRSCVALAQSPQSIGPWEEKHAFCPVDTLASDIHVSASLGQDTFPRMAYWNPNQPEEVVTCLTYWNADNAKPAVLAVGAKLDYCFVDGATKFLICIEDSSRHWNAWDADLHHKWQISLPFLGPDFVLMRSSTTDGYAVLVHLHARKGWKTLSPTIVVSLQTGEVFAEEIHEQENGKIRRYRQQLQPPDLDSSNLQNILSQRYARACWSSP